MEALILHYLFRGLLNARKAHTPQTRALPFSRLDVLVAAWAQHDRRCFRIVYPLAVFHKVF